MAGVADCARVEISGSHVVHETIDGEVIVVNMETGVYYGLRETAAEIWSLLAESPSTDEIVEKLARRYDAARDAVRGAVQRFVAQLAREALVVCDGLGAGPELATAGMAMMSLPFSLPIFEKFTDLEHLLAS